MTFSKEYEQQVPNYSDKGGYVPRTVRYTKICKKLGKECVGNGSLRDGR